MKPVSFAAAIALTACLASPLRAEPMSFPTPQDALDAFAGALTTPGRAALLGVFGDDAAETLSTGDLVEDRLHRIELIALLAEGYVDRVENVVSVGDEIEVVVINVDDRGKIKLSHRQALANA